MGLYSGGLVIGRIFASEIWGGGGRLFSGGLIVFLGGRGTYYRNFTVFLEQGINSTAYPFKNGDDIWRPDAHKIYLRIPLTDNILAPVNVASICCSSSNEGFSSCFQKCFWLNVIFH